MKRHGFPAFCTIYLAHHFYLEPALFHAEMRRLMADENVRRLEIIGFRGSAKSSYGSLAFPIYAALELPALYPFILPISDTGSQSGINVANIKNELEHNELIRRDYGTVKQRSVRDKSPEPTLESDEEWQSKNMLLSNGVRILARSRGQNRPRLVIVDDPEDGDWVRFKENRDASERWLRGEVLPAMDERHGKCILIGNYLHDDALMARAKRWGTFTTVEYPLVEKDGRCTWPAKYPTAASLAAARDDAGLTSWMREYLLKVVPEEGAPVTPDDIRYYDELPPSVYHRGLRGHGVDFAISLKASADCTACVHGDVYWEGAKNDEAFIYILPNPLNARLDFQGTLDYLKSVDRVMGGGAHVFFPEDVAYQKAAIQEMERARLNVHAMHPTSDKLARLRVAARYIKSGVVKFPRHGCEELIQQLTGFGGESHDDMADAFSNLILGLLEEGLQPKRFVYL